MYTVTIKPMNIEVNVPENTTLLEAEIKAGLTPDAPCGGKGTCGKCLIDIEDETGVLHTKKACCYVVDRDMTVWIKSVGEHKILETGFSRFFELMSPVTHAQINVEKGCIADASSDWDRIKKAIKNSMNIDIISPNIDISSDTATYLSDTDYKPIAFVCGNELLDLRSSDKNLAAAVDIGTTTIVLYLLDADSGETLTVKSILNPQTEYGADVIMRANYAIENGVEYLSEAIRKALNDLLLLATAQIGADTDDVYNITVVGNTCMHHLLLGINPQSLVVSPYHPAISEGLKLRASDFGIKINKCGILFVLPCIAGFVGADTSGVMLSCELDKADDLTLAIDIGTNGELVMGDRDRLVACSTAAGPAFEGAKLACGMRGVDGAIDHVSLTDDGLFFSTIGNIEPKGICGSGLMDLTAALLEAGIIDETGRIVDEDEIETEIGVKLYSHVRDIDGLVSFVISENSDSVYISQKDIREVQLAKGAMAAGIKLMLKTLGKKTEDIKRVLIAGAFGNYMSPESACRIGLIPPELISRIIAVGNAAGEGAKIAALSVSELKRVETMARNTEFIELASDPDFQDCFVEELMFPEIS